MHSIKQRGDTIVEVMLALTVIGMALGVSYGIANRSLATGQLAQERTEALKLAESQLEILKSYDDAELGAVRSNSDIISGDACLLSGGVSTGADCDERFFAIRLIYVAATASAPELFESVITWDPPQGASDAEVRLRYRP